MSKEKSLPVAPADPSRLVREKPLQPAGSFADNPVVGIAQAAKTSQHQQAEKKCHGVYLRICQMPTCVLFFPEHVRCLLESHMDSVTGGLHALLQKDTLPFQGAQPPSQTQPPYGATSRTPLAGKHAVFLIVLLPGLRSVHQGNDVHQAHNASLWLQSSS
jgi:hypothetical protein